MTVGEIQAEIEQLSKRRSELEAELASVSEQLRQNNGDSIAQLIVGNRDELGAIAKSTADLRFRQDTIKGAIAQIDGKAAAAKLQLSQEQQQVQAASVVQAQRDAAKALRELAPVIADAVQSLRDIDDRIGYATPPAITGLADVILRAKQATVAVKAIDVEAMMNDVAASIEASADVLGKPRGEIDRTPFPEDTLVFVRQRLRYEQPDGCGVAIDAGSYVRMPKVAVQRAVVANAVEVLPEPEVSRLVAFKDTPVQVDGDRRMLIGGLPATLPRRVADVEVKAGRAKFLPLSERDIRAYVRSSAHIADKRLPWLDLGKLRHEDLASAEIAAMEPASPVAVASQSNAKQRSRRGRMQNAALGAFDGDAMRALSD